jgi:hypothetical protein
MEALAPGSFITEEWEGGLSSGAIVLLLCSDAVPARLRREDWQPILDHATSNAQPSIASVLTGSCAYPQLLQRKNFFSWSDDISCLRSLDRWVIGLHEPGSARSFVAARVPGSEQRDDEINILWQNLVDSGGGVCSITGAQRAGKSALAQEFARVAGEQFRETIWVPCGDSSDAFILGEIASQLGVLDARSVPSLLREHRLLLIFDDVRRPLPAALAGLEGRSSILITTRDTPMGAEIMLPRMRDSRNVGAETIDDESLYLWQALSVCRKDFADVALAGRIADLHAVQWERALVRLAAEGVVERLDAHRVRVVSNCKAPDDSTLRRRHAEALYASLPGCWQELHSALQFTIATDWDLAQRMGQHAADLLRLQHRTAEAAEVFEWLLTAAEKQGREEATRHFRWELSWIRGDSGEIRPPLIAQQQLQLSLEL